MSRVEAFATGSRFLITTPSKAFDLLDFYGSKVNLEPRILDPLIFAVWRLP